VTLKKNMLILKCFKW